MNVDELRLEQMGVLGEMQTELVVDGWSVEDENEEKI